MIYLPPTRRFLLPAVVLLALIIFYRSSLHVPTSIPSFVLHQPPSPPQGSHISIADLDSHTLPRVNYSKNHLSPPSKYYYSYDRETAVKSGNTTWTSTLSQPILNPNLELLFRCRIRANQYTNHVRLPNIIQNISPIPPNSTTPESRIFWNPTFISLPYWSENQYLIVSRIVTDGLYQKNVVCEANICYTEPSEHAREGERPCTQDDLLNIGPAGGMRCATSPVLLRVPPTPAENCEGKYGDIIDIPGFHDPRVFWSGRGEPLMMVNTQLLSSSPSNPSLGPLKSYPHLTELTRNPANTRGPVEKNWMLFFTISGESYIHYDLSNPRRSDQGRTFAKVIGGGLTTVNLTDPLELPCIHENDEEPDKARTGGTWHQATNSLRLILCTRSDTNCKPSVDNTVFFAAVHRKIENDYELPLRYERFFVVWSAFPPFGMIGISQHPILMANETALGWSASDNWDDDAANAKLVAETKIRNGTSDPFGGKDYWAHFTYTVSIAYAWGRHKDGLEGKNVGYLDDEVVLGIGIDDNGQGFARVEARDLVQCLRACPGRRMRSTMRAG